MKIRFYQSPFNGSSQQQLPQQKILSSQHQVERNANAGAALNSSNRGSEENSDDFQAVAEEDMGSFIFHR